MKYELSTNLVSIKELKCDISAEDYGELNDTWATSIQNAWLKGANLDRHGIDGEVELFGVNIFDYKWENTKEIAEGCDFPIYKVVINKKEYEFAAEEVCNNGWCFYLPKE